MKPVIMVENYQTRPAEWADIPAIVELYNEFTIAQWGYPDWTLEDAETDLGAPGYNISESVQMWFDTNQTLVAVGLVFPLSTIPVRVRTTVCIKPSHPDFEALGLVILEWLERTSRRLAIEDAPEHARIQMLTWTHSAYEPLADLYRAYGMKWIRRFLGMEIALPVELPATELPANVTIRTLRYPDEAREAYRVSDIAFRDHYGHVPDPDMQGFDAWAHRKFSSHVFDPTLWFVLESEGEWAGFAWCHLGMPEDTQLGWIGTLGVLPEFRRRGYAILLLQHAFREFYARGMHKAGLGVDASSLTGATRLYERAGMHTANAWDTYAKVLRQGVEIERE